MTDALSLGSRAARDALVILAHRYHRMGWLFGTSGNLSSRFSCEQESPRVVITASGRNRRGIVLAVAQAIHDFGGDIRDISQTIVDDFFTMLVVIDIGNAVSRGSSLETLRGRLAIVSKELGVHIVAMHDDMLEAMHSV